MRILLACTALLSLLCFSACDKVEGCTDPSSLTFNQDATLDDGSCLYFADVYVGNYSAVDSVHHINIADSSLVAFSRQYTFSITKVNRGAVTLNGFNNNTCSPKATVTLTTLDLQDPMTDCEIFNFVATFDEGVLTYSYVVDTNENIAVSGVATWQQ